MYRFGGTAASKTSRKTALTARKPYVVRFANPKGQSMNHVKDLLKAGNAAVGTTARAGGEVRFLAGSGFDFILFDTQHSTDEIKGLAPAVAATRGTTAEPIIRVGDLRPDQICYALDVGAKGVVVPMVNTPEQAEDTVRWCRYPLAGERSSAGMRGEWGEFQSYREYMNAVNEQLLIIPMIETQQALDGIDEILAVPGIDVLLVGPSDLSINLDVPLDYPNPKYHAALDKALADRQITPDEIADVGKAGIEDAKDNLIDHTDDIEGPGPQDMEDGDDAQPAG